MKPHLLRHWPALAAGILFLLLCAVVAPMAAAEIAATPTTVAIVGTTTGSTSDSSSSTSTSGTGTAAASTGGQVSIESTTINPGSFFTGDTGTLTIKVANRGGSAIRISRASVASNEFECLNADTYSAVGTLEAGSTRELTFTLRAGAGNGVYYPEVQIDLGDAGSIRYAVPIRIDDSEIEVSLANAPDSYMKDQKNTVTVAVFNPRQNTVNGVTVTATGQNITVSDTAGFVGTLAADQARNVSFQVTPQESTALTLTVSYRNGLSDHSTVLTVPMTVDGRSTAADLVVNGVEVTNTAGTYTVKGDVTNAGIDDARGVVVTVGSPATPTDPNRNYVVGSLAADDFASFELTFTAQGARTVPLLVQYKDDDGRAYEKTVEVTLSGGSGAANLSAGAASGASASGGFQGGPPSGGPNGGSMFGLFGGGRASASSGSSSLPILPIAGALVVIVVLAVAWRKGWIAQARTRLRK